MTHTSCIRWWSVYVCVLCAYMFELCMSIQDFPDFHFVCVCTSSKIGGTVDTALLRRRLGVLLWADIRASMSSSGSSSENSCGWQHSHLIRRESAYGRPAKTSLCVAQFSSQQLCVCGWTQPASINSIRQVKTECGNLFTCISHTKSQCHWVYNKLVSMNGWVDLQRNRVRACAVHEALWIQMNTQGTQRQSSPILTIRSSTCFQPTAV